MKWLFWLILMFAFPAWATIIQSSNRIDWIPGLTIGVRGDTALTVPSTHTLYTNLHAGIVDGTGTDDLSTIINDAISNCPSNQYVLMSNGVFRCTTGLTLNKNGVELRCTNATLVGHATIGQAFSVVSWTNFLVTSGGGKGTTNVTLSDWLEFGNPITNGTLLQFSDSVPLTNENFEVISTAGYNQLLKQTVVVDINASGSINFFPPLIYDFTNTPQATLLNDLQLAQFHPKCRMGFRDVVMTQSYGAIEDSALNMVVFQVARDSYILNSTLTNSPNNYVVNAHALAHCTVFGNNIGITEAGTSHSGMLFGGSSGCAIANNAIFDCGQIGLQLWTDPAGNAIFANYFTNNLGQDIDFHNMHPWFNLVEHNEMEVLQTDGYYGSSSHQTIFRNYLRFTTGLKRFTSYWQIIGNVMGDPAFSFVWNRTNSDYSIPPSGIFEFDFPNIGNNSHNGIFGPFNFPGHTYNNIDTGEPIANGGWVATSTFTGTTLNQMNGSGDLSYVLAPNSANYPLKFQIPSTGNTNKYYPDAWDGTIILAASAGTSTTLELNRSVTVSNGWRLFVAGAVAYQQLENINGDMLNIHGNCVCTNQTDYTLVWDAGNADHDLPDSYLFSSKPSWWGDLRWPAIDCEASPHLTAIPARDRFFGTFSGGGSPPDPGTPAAFGIRGINMRAR